MYNPIILTDTNDIFHLLSVNNCTVCSLHMAGWICILQLMFTEEGEAATTCGQQ